MRTGTSISVLAHVAALTACLILAGVRPFEPTTAEAISVDIVTPDQVPTPKEKETSDLPALAEKDQQAAPEAAQHPPPPEPAKAQRDERQAALEQKQPEQPKPPEPPKPQPQAQKQAAPQPQQQPPAPPPQPQSAPQPEVPTAAPDITRQFGMMFTMPNGPNSEFDAKATATANITVQDAAALRAHIKSCAILPKSVSAADNVRIVLRVSLAKDGRLAREPLLIEASASESGPELMRSAIDALERCQPYAMLPPERYNEWRMLDLSFTPKDFKG